jgi:glycosyltransferase involved in cell wall biosynthesis
MRSAPGRSRRTERSRAIREAVMTAVALRIAQVAPLVESVPPRLYGGTERVVSWLTEELVREGHEVTLFASGDSVTSARLVACCPRAMRLDTRRIDTLAPQILQLERVFGEADRFDVLHFHADYLHFPLSRRQHTPVVTTLHGRLDLPDLVPMYREFTDMPLVSISDSQRRALLWANWLGTVPHGLPRTLYSFAQGSGGYLAFLGRCSPEKRVDHAIEIARRSGLPIRIAAKVDRADKPYFDQVVAPLLRYPGVEFIGEIGEAQKGEFLGNALALLFPVDWPEPFGIVMIESMACGTPVVAYQRGSIPEVLDHGVTGFIVDSIEEAVGAVESIDSVSRRGCREAFERRFTSERMARDYVELYRRLAGMAESTSAWRAEDTA